MKGGLRFSCLLTMTLGLVACQSIAGDPRFKLTLEVMDDTGAPIAGAQVRIGAERRPKGEESGGTGIFVEGQTDESGLFSGEVEAWNATQAGYRVEKEGHYGVWLTYRAKPPVLGKWQPWNPTVKVVLKRKINPVPMYAKRLALSLPKLDEPVAYDFVVGDWVAPNGQGKTADMVFSGNLHQEGDRKFDWNLSVSFPNPDDGIQRFIPDSESAGLRSSYQAPDRGYLSEWKLRRWRNGPTESEQTTFDAKAGYYFRVRTERDNDGKVVKALYGKIYGDFFDMVYYLNPDGTRNMEYDPKRNLLKPAKSRDRDLYEVGP